MSEEKKSFFSSLLSKAKSVESEMNFFDHLDVLRGHLVRSVIAVVLFTSLSFYYYDFLFDVIIMGPKRPDFWSYRMLCKLGVYLHKDGFCITEIPGKIINTEMAGQFTLQINSSLLMGLTLGVPYLLWEIWRFIKPGLHVNERKSTTGFVFFASMLFIIGVLFGYFIISPLSVNFLANYRVSDLIENTITVDSYLSTVATLSLATGLVFQLPIVIFILSKLGIMTPKFMREGRRYAVILILVIAAIVTPTPDMMTMVVVAIPLFVLYEISILVAVRVEKRRIKEGILPAVQDDEN